jgi:HSP20 family molecular chaperone IbpA
MSLVYTPYERLFRDIIKEFEYPEIISDSYFTFTSKEAYVIEAPLVGATKEELEIKVEGETLLVNAKPAKVSKFVKNTSLGFKLQEDADTDKVSARLENGLLTITIPRNKPEKKSINVKVN